MIPISFRRHFAKKLTLLLVSFVFACLFIHGCAVENQAKPEKPSDSENQGVLSKEVSNSEEINIRIVQAVLEHEFTGPNKEFIRLKENVRKALINPTEAELAIEEADRKKVSDHVRRIDERYFTESGLEGFMKSTPAHKFQNSVAEYQLGVEEMEVKQSDYKNASNQYHFTVQVAIESPGEEKTLYEVSGKAIFSEEGKIGRMFIADKDGLLRDKLNKLSNLD